MKKTAKKAPEQEAHENPYSYASLKKKQRELRDDKFPVNMALRVHRAISWIGRAEDCKGDDDAKFIFLWIAFNAAYADEREFQSQARAEGQNDATEAKGTPRKGKGSGERSSFNTFFQKIDKLDKDRVLQNAVWKNFSNSVRVLMNNKYVYNPFWHHQNGISGYEHWEASFKKSKSRFNRTFGNNDIVGVLGFIFDRLYVLRNQIVHGGSTWNSSRNRTQLGDGADILAFLMPVFIDLMMDNPDEDWGQPFYPSMKD